MVRLKYGMRFADSTLSVSSHSDRSLAIRVCDPRFVDWVGEARGRATGLVLTQPDGSLSASRAVLRCNRIQLDAMRDRANQPGFLFARLSGFGFGYRLPSRLNIHSEFTIL